MRFWVLIAMLMAGCSGDFWEESAERYRKARACEDACGHSACTTHCWQIRGVYDKDDATATAAQNLKQQCLATCAAAFEECKRRDRPTACQP